MKKLVYLFFLASLVTLINSQDIDPKQTEETEFEYKEILNQNEGERVFYVNTPDNSEDYWKETFYQKEITKTFPALIFIPSYTHTALIVEQITRLGKDGPKRGYVTAFSQGSEKKGAAGAGALPSWNGGQCCGPAIVDNVDDVAYFREIIKVLVEKYKVDPKKVFVTGWSVGGFMTYRLACELSDIIAGAAPFEGSLGNHYLPADVLESCKAERYRADMDPFFQEAYYLTKECQEYEFWEKQPEYYSCDKQAKEIPMLIINGYESPAISTVGVVMNGLLDDEVKTQITPTWHGPRFFREKYNCNSQDLKLYYSKTDPNNPTDITTCSYPSNCTKVIECNPFNGGHFWWSSKVECFYGDACGPQCNTFDLNQQILDFFDSVIADMGFGLQMRSYQLLLSVVSFILVYH